VDFAGKVGLGRGVVGVCVERELLQLLY